MTKATTGSLINFGQEIEKTLRLKRKNQLVSRVSKGHQIEGEARDCGGEEIAKEYPERTLKESIEFLAKSQLCNFSLNFG